MTAVLEYLILFLLPATGAFFGSDLKKKGENLATHEDIDKLVKQVSAITACDQRDCRESHARLARV